MNDFVPGCFHPKTPDRLPETFHQHLNIAQKHNSLGVKGCLIAMLSRRDTTKYLNKIKIPVLLLVGKKDALTPPDMMERMAKKIKKGKLSVVPKSGHMSPLENPEFVNRKIEKFLEKLLASEK